MELNHHEAHQCQLKIPWPGDIPGTAAPYGAAVLCKDGAFENKLMGREWGLKRRCCVQKE